MKKTLFICLILCLLLNGCANNESVCAREIWAMDTYMQLQLWGQDKENAVAHCQRLIRQLEDTWDAGTQLPQALEAVNASDILTRAEAMGIRTGGAFDPRLGALIDLWGFRDKSYTVPSAEQITNALAQPQWNLSGCLKGYTGQRLVQLLQQYKIDRALLNLGGNVQTYGTKPDGSPWTVGIQDPNGSGYVGVLSVEGTVSVVTSGDYQRYFEQGGIRYHHILDPKTGYPAQSGLRSVTVICSDGFTADALSTALYVMGLEDATRLWRESKDFEAVFITEDGKLYATAGCNLTQCQYEVIKG